MTYALLLVLMTARAELPTLNPTRVQWCESLLDLAGDPPADQLRRAVARAEDTAADALAEVEARRSEIATRAELELAEPHARGVRLNLDERSEAEFERELRSSRGRLARLTADLDRPDARVFAKVFVGAPEIVRVLDRLPERAERKQRSTGRPDEVLPIDPEYALRSLVTLGTLGCVSLGCTMASLNYYDVSDKKTAFFTSAGVLSVVQLYRLGRDYGAEFRSPGARIRLENTYNKNRADEEPLAAARLRALAANPHLSRRLFAHHGYSFTASAETAADLSAHRVPATPAKRRLLNLGADPFVVHVDLVLSRDDHDRPNLITTVRVLPNE